MASCKPVIAEPNSGNPVLVSHELGHVLGLLHPGGINSNSDDGTVMAPTGSAMNPGTVYATHFMCTNINNPVIQTLLGNSCCLTHDIGNHYLRDFPVDAGAEPSEPLPAGMTRYSMSNVWNRLTNTPGTFNMSTGPEHQQPVRFNSDGTPRTNYLFAQVEQINNLKVRNAVVKFFRKNPGSGGGGANLYLIGQVPVPDALAVGSAQTVSIPWTVPPGTPQHSCIFAVVRSDAEQEGDQSSLDWWQFETLSRNDNDWAQRNLDIQDYGSGNKREDNNVESAPIIIRLPPHDGHKKLKLSLEVDAMRAAGLKRLNLEIPGKERIKIKPGELVTVNPKMPVVHDEDIFLIIQAVITGGLPLGSSFIINVNPIVNNVKITGFTSEFHVSKPSEVIGQVIDTSMSAYVDMSDLIELPFAHDMVKKCKRLLSEPPYTLNEMAKILVQFNKIIKRGKAELKSIPIAKELGVIEAIASWENTITRSQKRKRSPLEVIEAFRKISTRLIAVAAILAEKQVSVISS
jgi:hypothetical protein